MNDGRVLAGLALGALVAVQAARGSRGVVRRGKVAPKVPGTWIDLFRRGTPYEDEETGQTITPMNAWSYKIAKWEVVWSWDGEGNDGDYEPSDPDDVPRLTVSALFDGNPVESHLCNEMTAGVVSAERLRELSETILKKGVPDLEKRTFYSGALKNL